MKNNDFLGQEKITKLLRKFSVPCILSMLISALYNIVDQIFIGNSELGYLGNAATSVVFPITIISFAFAWCFGDGAVALISLRQGQKKSDGVDKIIGNCLIAVFAASLLFIAAGFLFMEPLLSVFGASDVTIEIAKTYFTIILVASTASMASGVLSSIIRADGSPSFSMIVNISGALLNIIFDPLFIFGFKWGIAGAAYATIIGQIISFLLGLFYIFFRAKTFKLKKSSFKFEFNTCAQFTKLGISTFITQMAIVLVSLVCNMMLAKYGADSIYGADIPIAAMGISMKVFTIVINIVVGILVGAQPILGYNYGAEKFDRVKQTIKIALSATAIVSIIATLIFQLCPEAVINIFGVCDELYMDFSIKLFRIFLMLIVCTSLIKAISIIFQSIGESKKSIIVSLSRDIICFCPLCIILPLSMGIDGVLWAAPIADLIGFAIAVVYMVRFYRNLDPTKSKNLVASSTIQESKPGIIIAISRQHGSAGKEIGRLVAEELKIPYYYKELLAVAAKESGLSEKFLNEINHRDETSAMRDLYLGSAPAEYAISAQKQAIKEIAKHGSCVIVGRAADYVLRNRKDLLKVFIYAPEEYRIKKLHEMYGDDEKAAKKAIQKSDRNRSSYYNVVSGQTWGARENYDLSIDSSIGNATTAHLIVEYAKSLSQSK